MRRTVQLLAGIAILGGCGEKVPTETTARVQPQAAASRQSGDGEDNGSASLRRDLATLRRVTAPFHNFDKAMAAGWSTKITDCMADPSAGGMGFHYGNTRLINATVSVDKPELLLYEPEKDGGLRLVAVEYIIPYSFHSRGSVPPVLFGQQFKQNDTFQLWGLHAWVWKENPSGIFASWNPRVSCKYASAVSSMSH
ncbi:MAG: hypothetical protein M3037_05105 [Gemmatimonadota bacterium]|nr:hypothetical protein [Gemmatimonadota bacterium]